MLIVPTLRDRENQAIVDPIAASLQSLLELTRAVRLQRLETGCRKDERAPTLLGLQRLQHELLVDDLHLLTNPQLARLEVHVIPPEARRFAEPKTARECHAEQRTEAMLVRHREERS